MTLVLVTDETPRLPDKTYFTKRSMFGLGDHTAMFDIHPDEFTKRYDAWRNRTMLIQNAFPMLNADEREFILTGCTPEEWNKMFKGETNDVS